MHIVNPTSYLAGWNVGHRPDGRELAVVVVKASFVLSSCGEGPPQLADEPLPLYEADVPGPDPARSAPLHENDFSVFKPHCDILLRARAHTPGGRPVTRMEAGFMVGSCRKVVTVLGHREWRRGVIGVAATDPQPFTTQEIGYDSAFGGTDIDPSDPGRIELYRPNPAGTGYCRFRQNLAGMALPATEEPGHPVERPDGHYRPMAFGPLGRHWLPRVEHAGTYDERWQREKMPWLPDDFDPRYHQAAPPDQQIPYPQGGEPIVLAHLSPQARVEARLPREPVHVRFVRHGAPIVEVQAQIDTVFIEPDEDRLCLTWRASCPLIRDPFELREMQIETTSTRTPGLLRSRLAGKKHYRGLAALVRARKGGA